MNFLNLSGEDLDTHIYRIMKQEHVFSLFEERKNALSMISNWKDKFENFQMNLAGKLDGEFFEYGFKNDFAGQCWTNDAYSEAMWGIYANDPAQRYLRIRSTPRKLLAGLAKSHPLMPQDTCFVGKVEYKKEEELEVFAHSNGKLEISTMRFASSLLLKRRAFRHENEVRLLFFGDANMFDQKGLYFYEVDPVEMITQIMADPNRDRAKWKIDESEIKAKTDFTGEIKRSKIYDPPEWGSPNYSSV